MEHPLKFDLTKWNNYLQKHEGMYYLTVCCNCDKIRNNAGEWISEKSFDPKSANVIISHGLCPYCAQALYPEYYGEGAR